MTQPGPNQWHPPQQWGQQPPATSMAVTRKHRSFAWHMVQWGVCLCTAGLWLPGYLYLWRKPQTVTEYR